MNSIIIEWQLPIIKKGNPIGLPLYFVLTCVSDLLELEVQCQTA
jgi:hypothetical protein